MKKKYSYDELLEMEKTTIPLTMRKLEGIVFGYANRNAGDEMLGGYGGFSFILYDTGIIEVREYVFPQILAKEHFYQIPESCVSEIREVYLKYKDELDSLYAPDNGSCDGSFSEFFFGNKWISALNIDYHNEHDFSRAREVYQETLNYRAKFRAKVLHELENNPDSADNATFQIAVKMAQSFDEKPESFEKIKTIMLAENKIMTIFFAVCDILKKYGIVLEQFRVTVKGESTMTYSEFIGQIMEKRRNME
ncbi:MAG: hypothetical protein E7511_03380 [Ruminococcus sp.]|nr:hypothetical protein [Ruminococcus sp.]